MLLCPGGQAELIYTHRVHLGEPNRELVIYAGHKVGVRWEVCGDAAWREVVPRRMSHLISSRCLDQRVK